MEIVLHIGPHKTGTTSVQKFLRKNAKKPIRGIFYPPPPAKYGPGHALLAWQAIGLKGYAYSASALSEIIATAERKGINKLVLSAEDFSFAFFMGMDRLRNGLANYPIHLICTFTPVVRRVISEWQERVKHGACYLASDIPESMTDAPGLQPTLIRRFVEALNPCKTSVILAYSRNPLSLLNVVGDIIGLEARPDERTARANVSLGAIEVETLRAFNAMAQRVGLDAPSATTLRGYLQQLFGSEIWQQTCQKVPLVHPDAAVLAFAQRLGHEFDLEIDRLRQDSRITIYDTRLVDYALKTKAEQSRDGWLPAWIPRVS